MRRSDDVYEKPYIKTRTWVARLTEINLMLKEFPPNFSTEQMISDQDFIEIIEYGIPNTWRAKMVDQNFVPANHTLAEIVEFCEKTECSEKMLSNNSNPQDGKDIQQSRNNMQRSSDNAMNKSSQGVNYNKKRKQRDYHVSFDNSNGSDGCMFHTMAVTHTTNERHVLKKQVQKMKDWNSQSPQQQSNKRRKPNNSDNYKVGHQNTKGGDLHTLMEKVESIKDSLKRYQR